MDWHNFKVMSMYAVIVSIILFIMGQWGLAVLALIGYSMYGLFDCIKQYSKAKKLAKEFNDVPNYIKEITICHIINRNPKLKKSIVKSIKKDIASNNYKKESFRLIEKISIPPVQADAGYDYFLLFDNSDKYHVPSIVYDNACVGDTLWKLTTPTNEIKVIQSKNEKYFNMFTI